MTETPTAAPAKPKLWPKVLFWGGITLMVIGVVGGLGDWAARTIEMSRLLGSIEASERSMTIAKASIGAVTLPEDATQEQKDAATRELEEASAAGRDQVHRAANGVADVTFLPWHSELINAQGAYLAHNQAWVDYLDRGTTQPLSLFGDDNRIEPTWLSAEKYVRASVPFPALPPIAWRVDDIFRDEEPTDDQGNSGIPA